MKKKIFWMIGTIVIIKRITNIDVSPDGKRIAFTVMQAAMASEKSSYLSQVYLADADGSPPRQLTAGEFSCSAPQWSPDGRSIAFLSRSNIWLMSLAELPRGPSRRCPLTRDEIHVGAPVIWDPLFRCRHKTFFWEEQMMFNHF